ncbi:MAG: CbiX/SirB N-terminal domain-containing protein [Chitinophagaceae bacterium]|nr:CbiX/SirB N-terminal domain-containing protein [Chitinophagaceae bacterium]
MKQTNRFLFFILTISISLFSCQSGKKEAEDHNNDRKIGVLLVNHGSRSEAWRNSLLNLEKNVRDSILKGGDIKDVKTAFMEYTEPSIATRLKEFDKEGYSDVILVPVFLTVSSHSFDDIPTLIGQKDDPQSIEAFKIENMERYTPKAQVHITPLLDFTDILKKNILRRYQEISKDPANEGLVLIAYGDKTYNTEWTRLMQNVGDYVKEHTALTDYNFGWCGHLVHYSPDSTTLPVKEMLQKKKEAVVIPVLVAFDEMFQGRIITDGIKKVASSKEKVVYRPDAILPDKNVEDWVISASLDFSNKISHPETAKTR